MSSSPSSSREIKAISKNDVHRICSGQVVLNLATAVKELVENSLDAGATSVDVLVKDYGSELVQVADNGCGVLPENFQALTLKHHTSKLQDFSDLMSIDTFGFRGEALSSLCALSSLSIVTRHKSLPCATNLAFDGNGIITSTTQTARQVGTTVMLKNIFSSLPVRQKEFQRNLKREFSKMCQLLTAYCLVSTGIKITCINETKKGSRQTILATQGSKTVRDNIACVFTTKQLLNLLPVNEVDLQPETLEELKMTLEDSKVFRLEGFISSCAHGAGRSSADRQFYFINSRPCEPTKIIRTVNQIYHQFNANQSPFVFLNVIVARNCVDVNVTPDKRQIFLDNEKLLLAVIKETLLKLFESIPSTFKINNVPSSITGSTNAKLSSLWSFKEKQAIEYPESCSNSPTDHDRLSKSRYSCEMVAQTNSGIETDSQVFKGSSSSELSVEAGFLSSQNDSFSPNSCVKMKRTLSDAETPTIDAKQMKLNSSPHRTPQKDNVSTKLYNRFKEKLEAFKSGKKDKSKSPSEYSIQTIEKIIVPERENDELLKSTQSIDIEMDGRENFESKNDEITNCEENMEVKSNNIDSYENKNQDLKNDGQLRVLNERKNEATATEKIDCDVENYVLVEKIVSDDNELEHCVEADDNQNKSVDVDSQPVELDSGIPSGDEASRKSLLVDLSVENLERSFSRWRIELETEEEARAKTLVRFRAIIDPSKNELAEKELSREITKDMFQKMEVIGQFNLGFIIAKLKSDLFIVDQHATDEKYNFETLQKTTTLTNQKLVIPQKLELTAVNEGILIDNLEIFNANGFEFKIDDKANPTERISLVAIPMSKNWTFGKEDVDELLFMLQDSPHTLCRPSRVRAMFASRACRKSVMIGMPLNTSHMKSLLLHMAEIEQPWNCPHGRPTMRHLVNLDLYR
ncbi:mismatch repair endonuclease PMS2 [Nilaparvata lugens]|uniref:mismatch repair endonuclease PMS2 n=1 Tax=Nilaparvata lugens TaxID=108931 RepID=UPI00193D999D|nr:mismatch repair endonuclease PMS2 [Nilaparvata lugens]